MFVPPVPSPPTTSPLSSHEEEASTNIETIPYHPTHGIEDLTWDSPLTVLTHLLLHPEERDKLRNQACRRSPNESQGYYVQHPQLGHRLIVTSNDTDRQFTQTIESLLIIMEMERGVPRISPPFIVWHTQYILIRDPFNLVADPTTLAFVLRSSFDIPTKVLILRNETRKAPLRIASPPVIQLE
jgi:hypothetical protein